MRNDREECSRFFMGFFVNENPIIQKFHLQKNREHSSFGLSIFEHFWKFSRKSLADFQLSVKFPKNLGFFEIFRDFGVFANEIGKLWGFHLQKPHNLNFGIMGFCK